MTGKLSICMEKHIEYVGVNIDHNFTLVTTPTKCQHLCQKIHDCVAFTWDETNFGTYKCELKSEVNDRQPKMIPSPFLISGPKYCPGENFECYHVS